MAHAAAAAPALDAVHHAARAARAEQAAKGLAVSPYLYVADRHSTTRAGRIVIAGVWWHRWYVAYHHPVVSAVAGVPASFVAKMPCLARAEEYGPPGDPKGGYDTVDGFFGMISPPDTYPTGYGTSWLAIPYWRQIPIVYAEWLRYGSSPWPNTAPGCGL